MHILPWIWALISVLLCEMWVLKSWKYFFLFTFQKVASPKAFYQQKFPWSDKWLLRLPVSPQMETLQEDLNLTWRFSDQNISSLLLHFFFYSQMLFRFHPVQPWCISSKFKNMLKKIRLTIISKSVIKTFWEFKFNA